MTERQRCRGCRQYEGMGPFNREGYCPLCCARYDAVCELLGALDNILDCHIDSITNDAWKRAEQASKRVKEIGVVR